MHTDSEPTREIAIGRRVMFTASGGWQNKTNRQHIRPVTPYIPGATPGTYIHMPLPPVEGAHRAPEPTTEVHHPTHRLDVPRRNWWAIAGWAAGFILAVAFVAFCFMNVVDAVVR